MANMSPTPAPAPTRPSNDVPLLMVCGGYCMRPCGPGLGSPKAVVSSAVAVSCFQQQVITLLESPHVLLMLLLASMLT